MGCAASKDTNRVSKKTKKRAKTQMASKDANAGEGPQMKNKKKGKASNNVPMISVEKEIVGTPEPRAAGPRLDGKQDVGMVQFSMLKLSNRSSSSSVPEPQQAAPPVKFTGESSQSGKAMSTLSTLSQMTGGQTNPLKQAKFGSGVLAASAQSMKSLAPVYEK